MAIGVLLGRRPVGWLAFTGICLLLGCAGFVQAEDQIVLNKGDVINGQILGVDNGQVMMSFRLPSGGMGKAPYYVTDIKTITMDTPPQVTALNNAKPAEVITTLSPLVSQFAGLKVNWVLDAMASLADAYSQLNQADKALDVYNQINTFYPGSRYGILAQAGKAKVAVQAGKIDEALADVQPLIDQANKDVTPSPDEARLYANAFIVYGQCLEAKKQFPQALEAYLTVTTMLYQNQALVDQAQKLAQDLRAANPGVGVD